MCTGDFQSEVGELFGEIGGELERRSLAGKIFELLCAGEVRQKHFPGGTPPQISPSNFTTRFWVLASPTIAKDPHEIVRNPLSSLMRIVRDMPINRTWAKDSFGRGTVSPEGPKSMSFLALTEFVAGELSEVLSAYDLSASSLFQNSALKIVFCPFLF